VLIFLRLCFIVKTKMNRKNTHISPANKFNRRNRNTKKARRTTIDTTGSSGGNLFVTNFTVTLTEAFYTTRRIHKLLFAGKERVALGANTNFNFRTGGFNFPHFAACANNFCVAILRMNVFFHFVPASFIYQFLNNAHYGLENIIPKTNYSSCISNFPIKNPYFS